MCDTFRQNQAILRSIRARQPEGIEEATHNINIKVIAIMALMYLGNWRGSLKKNVAALVVGCISKSGSGEASKNPHKPSSAYKNQWQYTSEVDLARLQYQSEVVIGLLVLSGGRRPA